MITATRRRLRQEDGMSLIEVLAAVLIVGVAMAALASSSLSALASSRVAQDQVNAAQLINERVEHLLTRPVTEIVPATVDGVSTPTYPPAARSGVQYSTTVEVRWVDHPCNGAGVAPAAGQADVRADYLRMDVATTWTVKGTSRSLDTVMLRTLTPAERKALFTAGLGGVGLTSRSETC
ncbi:MAG: prepilin-type N-terminal cleavage/methylation domain-containing protein [Nitriliruptorales bacterium]|nr:prepilin-type N-terminal cleavage/methylation domain-containing protein [Nitriliruptorales bacterium]